MLEKYLSASAGYFRNDIGAFPWDRSGKEIWFALLNVEDGRIKEYGFTSSKEQKRNLLAALNDPASVGCKLLGVLHGQYSTHLFNLDKETAKLELARVT
jgi:hypothetical protein